MWEQTVSRDNLSGERKVIALLESPTFGSADLPFAASLAYAFADNFSERVEEKLNQFATLDPTTSFTFKPTALGKFYVLLYTGILKLILNQNTLMPNIEIV
ncbi:hypothetical protein TNCT_361151 [Trichonephila clavata]|uniref:Uncharacterized protein n=1 Tax=Trichonephila clavata TaxID=2740835 RepID=A0A8X6J671_TRICU|nr:hypothetical protein TNCT_361151 [Trichonephila clavata]